MLWYAPRPGRFEQTSDGGAEISQGCHIYADPNENKGNLEEQEGQHG